MTFFVEHPGGAFNVTRCMSQKTDDHDPIRVSVGQPLNYEDMTDYIRSWPDKLVSFVAERLCEDHMRDFARELYEYICRPDAEGPNFEEWRTT